MTLTLQYDDFMTYVHKLAKQPDSNYMDAVLDYAQKNDIEIEALGDIIRKIQISSLAFRTKLKTFV